MKTLVLGLGNPTLTDDAVGLAVAREVRKTVDNEHVAVREASVGGLSLLHLAEGYDRVIIIDAFENGAGDRGKSTVFRPMTCTGAFALPGPVVSLSQLPSSWLVDWASISRQT